MKPPLRRGVQSANSRWGNTVAILTGDYLFARTSDMLADLGPAAVHLQAQTFERLVIGQIMETQGPAEGVDPLQHYLSVVADKTGSLIAASAQFGAMLAGAPGEQITALAAFGEKIGITFQLVDDVIDIASQSDESGKTPGTDLKEGVPTLVTLNVMKSNRAQDRDLQELLKGPISDQVVVNQVLDQLRQHPALDQSREQVLGIANQARQLLGPLPVNDATSALFSLCDAVIDRSALFNQIKGQSKQGNPNNKESSPTCCRHIFFEKPYANRKLNCWCDVLQQTDESKWQSICCSVKK